MILHWYARQVATRPLWIILIVLALSLGCISITFFTSELPSFEDPLLGFEARGTPLSQRAMAWKNLLSGSSWSGPLSLYPGNTGPNHTPHRSHNSKSLNTSTWQALERRPKRGASSSFRHSSNINLAFCNDPGRDYAQVIFKSKKRHGNLFTVEALRSICWLDWQVLRNISHFSSLCEQVPGSVAGGEGAGECCPSWSVPNYIAQLQNLSSCASITEHDIEEVTKLLNSCAQYYFQMKLSHDCASEPAVCRGVPRRCFRLDAVYNILHYLTDVGFINKKRIHLTYTALFLPLPQSVSAMPYYTSLMDREGAQNLADNTTEMVAMELGLKYALFDRCLIRDSYHLAFAAGLVFLLLWIYSASFIITLTVIASVLFSLGLAYCLYTSVFQIPFFPFMNLLAIVIAIGIGADDACVYCKLWTCAKVSGGGSSILALTTDTLQHGLLSMLVTSLTTALAFYGSYISQVTAIACFSIFAGTAVLSNFFYTITWLPASIVLAEQWCSSKCCLPPFGFYVQISPFCASICNFFWKLHYSIMESSRIIFEKLLPCILIKPRYLWLFALTSLAVGSAVAIFYYPQLQLPDSKVFQIFNADHPFEMYDLHLKHLFWFEKAKERDFTHVLPLRFVWGVLPVDDGNYLDPFSKGELVMDPDFNMSDPKSQKWLLDFCRKLRGQDFFRSTPGPLLFNCFIETFKSWMERRCVDGVSNLNRTPCCQTSIFPYSEAVFTKCLKEAISILHHNPGYFYLTSLAGPRFSKESGHIKAFVIEYESNHTYSTSYVDMHNFYTKVEEWFQQEITTAPPGLKNGWFISELEFYDLQDSLWKGTLYSIGLAVGVSFLSVLLTTLNLLISLFAITTITFIILTTLGCLVIIGWKLNVLESVITSVTIGLAVDLTLHYGVAYRLSPQEDRESSVIFALSRVGTPVAMAAFTTFVAGLIMLASIVLAYIQIATFLMLLIASSWFFSTFFFLPLLSRCGPKQSQLQLNFPSFKCCKEASLPPPEKNNPYALSESTLSTSSASYYTQIPTSESHELEPLTLAKVEKHSKKIKKNWRSTRKRSESFSSDPKEGGISIVSTQTARKISLPTVHFNFEETDKNSCLQPAELSNLWTKREISV